MKVVLLAGGLGSRITEESQYRPKPMVELGGMPILWHIMKEYSYYGFNDFIICAGYKQFIIKDWFADYFLRCADVQFDFRNGEAVTEILNQACEPWRVAIIDTGLNTMTGGRIKRIQKYVGREPFMMTYGDGVCDVNISDLLSFHQTHGKIATITAVFQEQSKGTLDIGEDNTVRAFREKQGYEVSPINAGYMILEPGIFEYLDGDDCVFEQEPMRRLAEEGQLKSYKHHGFWQCMDNIREKEILEKLIASGKAPWMKWI